MKDYLDYHCEHPHPTLPGRTCNALIRARVEGEVEIECPRCRRSRVLDTRPVLTGVLTEA